MLLEILLGVFGLLVIVVAMVLIYAATRPDTFRIERSATMQAPPDKVFPLINDFHNWANWSPWDKIDPALKRTYSGAASGKGAIYEWEGNKQVGQGRMEILDAPAPAKVQIQLDFLKPFEAHNTAEFTLAADGGGTNVTWAMYGRQPFMFKVMSLVMSMDKMIGKDFEKGLASMKELAEKA
jgi:hypothetical protein